MSKMTCAEAIYEVLAGKYNAVIDHECFDDVFMGCFALASGESNEPDVLKWIAARDKERTELEICLDICDYFRKYHGTVKPTAILAKAIAAGKAAL